MPDGLATLLADALARSRDGDVEGAADLLRAARRAGPVGEAHMSLLFQLIARRTVDDEAFEVASAGLKLAGTPVARSTWALRRSLLHLERGARTEALADLQLVMKLKANEGHMEQARALLLRVAQLPKAGRGE